MRLCWNSKFCFCSNLDLGWIDLPFVVISDEMIKRYKCNEKELVDMKLMFVTDLEYQSYNHYLQQPRPMIEKQICKIIDRNPNLIKTLNKMPSLYSRYINIKQWGLTLVSPRGIIRQFLRGNWENREPNINTRSPLISINKSLKHICYLINGCKSKRIL